MRVRPENAVSELATQLYYTDSRVEVLLPEKNERFRAVVRAHGYRWRNHTWQRALDGLSGLAIDRAAEIGRALLSRGFVVDFPDEVVQEKAITGTITPETTRWLTVSAGQYSGWLLLRWRPWDDCYDMARALHGSRYDRQHTGVAIPLDLWAEALDFAEENGFRVLKNAEEAIAAVQAAQRDALVVNIPAPQKRAKSPKPTTYEVVDALRDDPL